MGFGSVVPKELAGEDTTAFSAAPVGTGPSTSTSYTKGEKAVLKRNTSYWRAGYPQIDTVEYRLLRRREHPAPAGPGRPARHHGQRHPVRRVHGVAGDPTYRPGPSGVAGRDQLPDPRLQRPDSPLSNVKVRQAIAKAIDKDNHAAVNNGRGDEGRLHLPAAADVAMTPSCDPYPCDVEGAKKLINEAGFGERFRDDPMYTDTQDPRKTISESMIQDLAQIGIKVDLVQQDFDVLIGTITTPARGADGVHRLVPGLPGPVRLL